MRSRTPNSGFKCTNQEEESVTLFFANLNSKVCTGFKKIFIGGLLWPTQKAQVARFALLVRMLGGRLVKAR